MRRSARGDASAEPEERAPTSAASVVGVTMRRNAMRAEASPAACSRTCHARVAAAAGPPERSHARIAASRVGSSAPQSAPRNAPGTSTWANRCGSPTATWPATTARCQDGSPGSAAWSSRHRNSAASWSPWRTSASAAAIATSRVPPVIAPSKLRRRSGRSPASPWRGAAKRRVAAPVASRRAASTPRWRASRSAHPSINSARPGVALATRGGRLSATAAPSPAA